MNHDHTYQIDCATGELYMQIGMAIKNDSGYCVYKHRYDWLHYHALYIVSACICSVKLISHELSILYLEWLLEVVEITFYFKLGESENQYESDPGQFGKSNIMKVIQACHGQ